MKTKNVVLATLSMALSTMVLGQDLPKPSPLSKVEQVVGLNKIAFEYSRPSAKGRVIFGDLVAFDEPWRLGANQSTKMTITEPMIIGKNTLKAGTYAMYAIVSKDNDWTIVFSNDLTKNGADEYDKKDEAARITVKAKENSFTETLSIETNNVSINSGAITIAWEKLKAEVPFTLDTDKTAETNIQNAIKEGKDLDKVYYRAASYSFDKGDVKAATKYIDLSIKENKMHSNLFLKAQILYKDGKTKEAIVLAEEAHKMALAVENKGWANYIAGTLEKWNK